mmetsp:Transcript_75127/g.189982  ORF Transcript_75127/g.189982 Transcript_75127/m.189982 type:complete len:256 (-) Transcript_75127:317-1084(-)
MVTLWENPSIEVRRHILANVHLGALLVVLHLVLRDAHALLERDGVLVVAGLDLLGDPAVRAITTDDDVNLQGLLHTLPGIAISVLEVVVRQDVRLVLGFRQGHGHEEAVDQLAAILRRAVAQVRVQHLSADHANELLVLQRLPNLYLFVGRRDHGHLADLPVHDLRGQIKLSKHAQRDGATAGLAIVELPLDEIGLDARLRQLICAGCSARAAANDRNAELAALWEAGASADNDSCIPQRLLRRCRHHTGCTGEP